MYGENDMRKRSFSIGALSEIGYVKKTNQDRILIKIGEGQHGEFGIFVVADGMGGLTAGDRASEIVIKEFKAWWDNKLALIFNKKESVSINMIDKELNSLIINVNKKVMEFGRGINSRVGTTLSMMFIHRNEYIIKHIGDSRIYKINHEITRLTQDHSWIEQQIRSGCISKQEAVNHPQKHILLQCVGVKEVLDIFETKGEISEEDKFLLCSDGFYNLLRKNEMLKAVGAYDKNNEDVQEIVEELMGKVRIRGALDNASAILICQDRHKQKLGLFERLRYMIG
jgi:serine/threonine protein phosphatase PrpC